MANNNSSNATQAAILEKTPVPYHQYHDWLLPEATKNANAKFAAMVMDVARGTRVIAGILHAHLVDLNAIAGGAGDSITPLLSENDTEALARLAVHSLDQLSQVSSDLVDRLNAEAETENKEKRGGK